MAGIFTWQATVGEAWNQLNRRGASSIRWMVIARRCPFAAEYSYLLVPHTPERPATLESRRRTFEGVSLDPAMDRSADSQHSLPNSGGNSQTQAVRPTPSYEWKASEKEAWDQHNAIGGLSGGWMVITRWPNYFGRDNLYLVVPDWQSLSTTTQVAREE